MVTIVKVLCDECTAEIKGSRCFRSQVLAKHNSADAEYGLVLGDEEKVFCSLSCQIIYNDRKARQVAGKSHYDKSYRKAKGLPVEFMNEEIGLVREEDCTTEKGMRVVKTEVFWKALEGKIPKLAATIIKKTTSKRKEEKE